MRHLVILENDADQAEMLRLMIACYPRAEEFVVEHVSSVRSLEQALLKGLHLDVLVTDIDLGPGSINGIEAVDKLIPRSAGTQVIYVTGYIEYCTSVYKTDHIYFLRKPVNKVEMFDALDTAMSKLAARTQHPIAIRESGEIIPISQKRRKKVRAAYLAYLREGAFR